MPEFNKLFVMLPVMLAARKLDGEDPGTLQMVRIAYGVVQTVCVLCVLWTYVKASAVQNPATIYVPPPPQVCVLLLAVLVLSPFFIICFH